MTNQQNAAPLANTVTEACERLRIARNSLYNLINAGEITPIKIGSRTLIPESELARFMASRLALQRAAA